MADISRLSRFVAGLPHDVETDTNTLVLKSLKLTDNISDNAATELTENALSFLNGVYNTGLPLDHLVDTGVRTQVMVVENAEVGYQLITTDNVDVLALVVTPFGGTPQEEDVDYQLEYDVGYSRKLVWSGLGLEETVVTGDKLLLQYSIAAPLIFSSGGPEMLGDDITIFDGGVP